MLRAQRRSPALRDSGIRVPAHLFSNDAFAQTSLRAFSSSRTLHKSDSEPKTPPQSSQAPNQSSSSPSLHSALPHLTSTGAAHMVSVTSKPETHRTAVAVGTVLFSNATPLSLIRANALKKGDVLSVSRIAGIMAAKKCPDIIPLCHPIAISYVGVDVDIFDKSPQDGDDPGYGGIHITATVSCTGPTGVEMEALTAVMGAALTIVDMCKAVDKGQRVQDVRVVKKEGGRSGTWREEGWDREVSD